MSDIDPTPETPVTQGDRLGWFRGDVNNNHVQQLAAIAALAGGLNPASLRTLADAMAELVAVGEGLQGTRPESLTTITDALFTQGSPRSPLLLLLDGKLDELITRVDSLQAALGAVPYGSLEVASVRGLLWSLVSAQGNVGIAPDQQGSAVTSLGTLTTGGRRYAVWANPIVGVTRSTDNTELTPVSTWSGYQIYVQSDADTFRVSDLPEAAEYPTNSWLTAPLAGTIRVSVPSQNNVKGYMRTPAGQTITLASEPRGTNNNGTWHVLRWGGYPELAYGVSGGLTFYELNNGDGTYNNFVLTLPVGTTVFRSNNRAATGANVSGAQVIGNNAGVSFYRNSPFTATFGPPA